MVTPGAKAAAPAGAHDLTGARGDQEQADDGEDGAEAPATMMAMIASIILSAKVRRQPGIWGVVASGG
jgi:hypothetical protein